MAAKITELRCDKSQESDVKKHQHGVQLQPRIFRNVGCLFVPVKDVIHSVRSVDVVFHLSPSMALWPFDLSWILMPLLRFCSFMHVARTTRAFVCILKT